MEAIVVKSMEGSEEGSARLVFVWHSVYVYEDSFVKLVEDAMQG